jgi:hypothetical protein
MIIWEVLDKQGRTLQWFADKMHVSPSYVYKLKAGTREWTAELKARAAEILDIPQYVLFLPNIPTDVCHGFNLVNLTLPMEGRTAEKSK